MLKSSDQLHLDVNRYVRKLCFAGCPRFVYHYTSLSSLLSILATNTIWCSYVKSANDPTEVQYGIDIVCQKLRFGWPQSQHQYQEVIDALRINHFVGSFSALSDSLPQWRAYCRGGRGVAVEVEVDSISGDTGPAAPLFARVEYIRDKQEATVALVTDEYANWLARARPEYAERQRMVNSLVEHIAILSATFKHPSYASEGEVRIIVTAPPDPDSLPVRASLTELIPYVSVPLSAAGVALNIRRIIVGPCLDWRTVASQIRSHLRHLGRDDVALDCSSVKMRPT